MINRHIIQVILSEYNRNILFNRGNSDDYHNLYLSSFYITKCNLKRNNVAFKFNGKNKIIKTLDSYFEDNDYNQLKDAELTIRKTIHYIKVLNENIEELPEEINKGINKYLPLIESKKIDGTFEVNSLRDIAENLVKNVEISGYFEKTDQYVKVLMELKKLINETLEDKKNLEKNNLLKHTYEDNIKYLKTYIADISPITNEIDNASQHIHELFKKIRAIGIITCNADSCIENKKTNVDKKIEYATTPIQDSTYKNLYVFKDNSILFEYTNGSLLEVIDNDHLDRIQNEIMFNSIGFEFRKHPKIEKLFKNAIRKKPDYLGRIIGIADQYKQYSCVLKDAEFKILDEILTYTNSTSGYEMLEEIRVKIQKISKTHNVKVFAYSIASKKYKHLYDKNVMSVMEMLYGLKIEKEILQEQIGSKIAAYKTPEDFASGLKRLYYILTHFTKEHMLEKVNQMKTKITYEADELLILEINSFQESSVFSAPSWCISREEKYFKSYTNNGAKQYSIYNFKSDIPERNSLIGITLNGENVKAANYRNNDNINRSDNELISLIEIIKNVEMKKDTD